MRTKALVALLLAAAAASAQARPAGAEPPLVRIRDGRASDLLLRLDPRTLRQVGRPIRTFRNGADLAFTPDGGTIAYSDATRRRSRIHLVDLGGWRSLGVVRLGHRGQLQVAWASDERLLAFAGYEPGRKRLLWIDVRSGQVVARRSFTGWALGTLAVPGGAALALAPETGVGPLRILLADADGGARTITVEGIRAGSDHDRPRGEVLTPAVTVDPEGGRLYAVAARGLLVADVKLASGAVTYHSLRASAAKGDIEVWWRHAVWAGRGRIALTGEHWPRPRGRLPDGPVPFGARVIDTVDWTVDILDPRPSSIHVAGDTLLASGTRWFDGGRRMESTGLLAFAGSGERAFTRFRGRDVAVLGSRGTLAYAWVRRARRAHVVDLHSGRTLHSIRTGRRIPFLLSP